MKLIFVYIFIFLSISGCKTEKKEGTTLVTLEKKSTNVVNKKIIDSVKIVETEKKDPLSNFQKPSISKDSLIGKIITGYSQVIGFEEYNSGGAIIEESFNGKEYSLSELQGKGDIANYVIFEENTDFNENGGKFKVLDILDLTGKEYELLSDKDKSLYIHFCYKDGENDQEIIAIAQYDENEEFLTTIYKAWRADRKTEKIIEIPIDGIKVENVGYGL